MSTLVEVKASEALRTRLAKNFEKIEKAGKPVRAVYYSPTGKHTFFVNILDPRGEYIPKKHPKTGTDLYQDSKLVYEQQMLHFSPVIPVRTSIANALSQYVVESGAYGEFSMEQKEVIFEIESQVEDKGTNIISEKQYKEKSNPEAYKTEQRFKKLEAGVKEKEEKAFEAGKKEGVSEIDKLKKQIATFEKKAKK